MLRPDNAKLCSCSLTVPARICGHRCSAKLPRVLPMSASRRFVTTFRIPSTVADAIQIRSFAATARSAVAAAKKSAPDLMLLAGGHSFGGRMTSTAASQSPLDGVRGLVFFSFPLHPPGKPETERADHLFEVNIPMLFLTGTRDEFATGDLLPQVVKKLGNRATLHLVETGDHGFKVLKRRERKRGRVCRTCPCCQRLGGEAG